ncbi:MAG: hypothetical protein WA880_08580 [Ornithinimicrobium sp.]
MYHVSIQKFSDGLSAATQSDVSTTGGFACLSKYLGGLASGKVECPVSECERRAKVVGQDEHRGMEGRLITPPPTPFVVGPPATLWAERVAPHDLGTDVAAEITREVVVEDIGTK